MGTTREGSARRRTLAGAAILAAVLAARAAWHARAVVEDPEPESR